jgi:Tfp pilus assembly protein PilW
MNNFKLNKNKGLTVVELLISVAILGLLTGTVTLFQRDIFTLNFTAQSNLSAQLDGRHILKQISAELREASPSSLGAYPIALASSSALTFYTDKDNNGVKERIRYYLSGKNLMRAVLVPTGSPLVYNSANEVSSISVSNIANPSNTPIFQYFDTNYAGTTSPLAFPVDITKVRLVKITTVIEKDPNKSPTPITVTTQVNIRNLKDNL